MPAAGSRCHELRVVDEQTPAAVLEACRAAPGRHPPTLPAEAQPEPDGGREDGPLEPVTRREKEGGDPSVSLDLLIRALLFSLVVSRRAQSMPFSPCRFH